MRHLLKTYKPKNEGYMDVKVGDIVRLKHKPQGDYLRIRHGAIIEPIEREYAVLAVVSGAPYYEVRLDCGCCHDSVELGFRLPRFEVVSQAVKTALEIPLNGLNSRKRRWTGCDYSIHGYHVTFCEEFGGKWLCDSDRQAVAHGKIKV